MMKDKKDRIVNETAEQVVQRFKHVYIGDSLIERLVVDFQKMHCTFILSAGSILKDDLEPSIFDPVQRYRPAALIFFGVVSMSCIEGDFYLNSTIVDFEATVEKIEI